jgi:hypothetical protein
MAYTQTDLDDVNAAIKAYVLGRRVEQVGLSDKSVRYAAAKLSELYALKSQIELELGNVVLRAYAKNGGRASV